MMSWLLLLWACQPAGSDDAPLTGTGGVPGTLLQPVPTGDDTATERTGDYIALDWSRDTADGGDLWVLLDARHASVEARLGDTVLEGRQSPGYPALWMFEVPADQPEGAADLELTSLTTGGSEALPITVHAARFVDVATAIGLDDIHDPTGVESGCAQALTGLAWADIDLDGDFDAILGHYGFTSRVLRNEGAPPGQLPDFTDVTAGSGFDGVGQVGGIAIVDIEGDGDPDVYVARRGTNQLFRNDWVETGRIGFTDITEAAGVAGSEQRTMGAVFGDPDNDGDVDFYEVNHTWCFPGSSPDPADNRIEDTLWRNDGGFFKDISSHVDDREGALTNRYGFVGMWIDHERDGDLDLFVVNDFVPGGGPNVLLRNDDPAELVLTDVSVTTNFGLHPDPQYKGLNGMGLSVGDLNHDGYPDFAVSNIGPNVLLMSDEIDGKRGYLSMSEALGTLRPLTPWGTQSVTWGTQMFDHDNDGDLELFYVGGNIRGSELVPHAFFDNEGETFRDLSFASGLSSPGHGKASALVDLDNDGFLDLAVANWAGALEVYRNTTADRFPDHHWLMVELEGDGVHSHRDAMGSIVTLTTSDGYVQTCFRSPRPSLSGGGDPACHFGLGTRDTVASLQITWPDGHEESVAPPAVDQRVRFVDRRP